MIQMPLYEYVCRRCSKNFEELVSKDAAAPECPACARSDEVTRIPFATVTVGKKEDLRPPDIKSFTRPRRW
jgi:putative FmdB family regulatory protein